MKRHAHPVEWKLLAKRHERGAVLPPHAHGSGQLVFALSGVMQVDTEESRWTVPPQRALWIPPAQRHSLRMLSATEMRTVYFTTSFIGQCEEFETRQRVHAIEATPLIKELIGGLFGSGHQRHTHRLMALLLLQVLSEAAPITTELPMPADPRLRRAADEILSTRSWDIPLGVLAALAAMSERTFTRRFSEDTGMNLRIWKQRARICASLDMLAAGSSVKQAAHQLGFSGPAAYVASFRAVLGCTPSRFA